MTTSENNIDQDELIALLPWYLNGTLEEKEQQAVEQLLESSQAARDELAVLKKIQQQVLSEDSDDVASELGWQRLKRDMRAADAKQVSSSLPQASNSHWYKMAGMAAVLVICVQFGLLWKHVIQPADVELLGGGQTTQVETVSEGIYFQVQFDAAADWQEINALLGSMQAEIVQGPSALGLVMIRLPASAENSEESLLELLMAQTVIQHVQSVDGE